MGNRNISFPPGQELLSDYSVGGHGVGAAEVRRPHLKGTVPTRLRLTALWAKSASQLFQSHLEIQVFIKKY